MRLHALLALTVGLLIAADAKDDAAKTELKKLSGTYVMVSGEEKGEKMPEKRVNESKLVIDGNKHTVNVGEEKFSGTQKVDPTKTPKEIDATDKDGKTMLGIYKFEKDEFTVSFAPTGKDRPKEFSTKAGTGELLHVWKRQKK